MKTLHQHYCRSITAAASLPPVAGTWSILSTVLLARVRACRVDVAHITATAVSHVHDAMHNTAAQQNRARRSRRASTRAAAPASRSPDRDLVQHLDQQSKVTFPSAIMSRCKPDLGQQRLPAGEPGNDLVHVRPVGQPVAQHRVPLRPERRLQQPRRLQQTGEPRRMSCDVSAAYLLSPTRHHSATKIASSRSCKRHAHDHNCFLIAHLAGAQVGRPRHGVVPRRQRLRRLVRRIDLQRRQPRTQLRQDAARHQRRPRLGVEHLQPLAWCQHSAQE